MRIILFGHGRMGRLVGVHAADHDGEVVGVITSRSTPEDWAAAAGAGADVVIDFATGEALEANLERLCGLAPTLVLGSTGWGAFEPQARAIAQQHGRGVVAASNFSVGAYLMEAAVRALAPAIESLDDYEPFLHEAHHSKKRDAPSGTALQLLGAMRQAGLTRHVDVSATRAGHIPGTHTVGVDGPTEAVTVTHLVRDRATFAHGALRAARWVQGRTGWYSMKDVLGI
ncbi:4-hydroxy-tetrahydrodipicolinate reductase [Luteitalea sp. TBR-22]|uniref:4-hydroxy-tetrahydrodipicolinate reductase n=1 Tax=Luteitalea sp. TBR-22 TaxID=2802971 RepID=UPI001AFA5FE9|nr:dihydrodipicolinate reductase C-terminal domain-containing protein [Luteitalea sp. TBR-22]BCS35454.1 4-hydroxy-tetrahydrodipicolinate reductase [Luteitalea sp. TBR-22]